MDWATSRRRLDATFPCLRPWLASLLGLGWLLGLALPGARTPPSGWRRRAPRSPCRGPLAAPQVAQAVRVWSAVATELFRSPHRRDRHPRPLRPHRRVLRSGPAAPASREVLTYYAGVLTPPGGDPTPRPWSGTRHPGELLHLVGHAVVALLHLPVPVEAEEAADAVGVALLAVGSPEDERTVLAGSAASSSGADPGTPHLVPWWPTIPGRTRVPPTYAACSPGVIRRRRPWGQADPPTPPCRAAWQRWQTLLTPSLRLAAAPPEAAPPPPSPPLPPLAPSRPGRPRPTRRRSRRWRAYAPTTRP